jgi:hypothetical protein
MVWPEAAVPGGGLQERTRYLQDINHGQLDCCSMHEMACCYTRNKRQLRLRLQLSLRHHVFGARMALTTLLGT